jgi:hypothetical protein
MGRAVKQRTQRCPHRPSVRLRGQADLGPGRDRSPSLVAVTGRFGDAYGRPGLEAAAIQSVINSAIRPHTWAA